MKGEFRMIFLLEFFSCLIFGIERLKVFIDSLGTTFNLQLF